jgi:ribonuclease HI
VITSPRGDKFCYVLRLIFPCTNNAAEYEALLHGLRMAKEMNLSRVRCLGDSDLVAQQVSGTWDSKDPLMAAYRHAVTNIARHFKGYQVDHINRRQNEAVDALSRLASQRKPVPPNVFLDVLHNPSDKLPTEEDLAIPDLEVALVAVVHAIPDWTIPYLAYLSRGELPAEEIIARQIIRRSKSMTIINGELHRRSVTRVFQRCVSLEEGRAILNEIHSGDCGHHAGSRSLVAKAFWHGFYWLTAHADAEDIVRKCDGCQKYAR